MFIRQAHKEDLKAILDVLDAAKGIMRASGNTRQWENGYPSEEVILHDIRKGYGYVVEAGSGPIGYFAFIPSPNPPTAI